MNRKWLLLAAAVTVIVAALAVGGVWLAGRHPVPTFTTAAVQRGDIVATVTATGTIEPEEVIDVGAQVVGKVEEFGRDPQSSTRPVDFGTAVEDGTVLARIDDALYRARRDKAAALVEQAKAQVASAEADLGRAEANAKESTARARQATREWERIERLRMGGSVSEQEADAALSAYEVTKAEVVVTEAAIRQAKATLNAAQKTLLGSEADLRETQKNLDYTVIRSPVKGVIVDRRVNVGQTVVSSLNAPSLFLIAKDLRRLQVLASVNEADIGRISPGLPVVFSVDAYPGEQFRGQVSQVRLNATMTQNVVTYTVVVTDNPDGKLLPYLTASLKFETGRRSNALLVPNAALRWQPTSTLADHSAPDRGAVWVPDGVSVRRVDVRTGLTDGVMTEVIEGDLHEGDALVIGEAARAEAGPSASPFTPNITGRKK